MRSFRIATIACVLSVAVPAAAGASQANRPDGTTAGAAHKLVTAKGPYGATPAPGTSPKLVAAKGPYGATPAAGTSPKLVAAKGPYGAIPADGSRVVAARITALSRVITGGPDRFHWADAAIGAGGTLGAILLASAGTLAVTRRRTNDGRMASA